MHAKILSTTQYTPSDLKNKTQMAFLRKWAVGKHRTNFLKNSENLIIIFDFDIGLLSCPSLCLYFAQLMKLSDQSLCKSMSLLYLGFYIQI